MIMGIMFQNLQDGKEHLFQKYGQWIWSPKVDLRKDYTAIPSS